ncbi:MAG: polyphosphate kinase 2 [Burkholderiaceae bacterium]
MNERARPASKASTSAETTAGNTSRVSGPAGRTVRTAKKQPAAPRKPVKSAAQKVTTVATKNTRTGPVKEPRRASLGDTVGTTQAKKIGRTEVGLAVEARQGAQLAMVRDILSRKDTTKADKAESLRAILEGAAPDDAKAIRQLLKGQAKATARAKSEEVDPNEQLSKDWRSGAYPYKNLLSRRVYEANKYLLQVELLKLQAWVKETGQRVVILFEGRDAAGKGGTIKRVMEHLNPRGARVVALEKPSDIERGQWYFQRYVQHLPTAGEIVLFDRSWYNRAGVERVMGFCSDEEYREFMRQAPQFESQLARSGVHLIKFWFSVSREEQRRRFKERKAHPQTMEAQPDRPRLAGQMGRLHQSEGSDVFETDTADAPWTVIKSDCKKRARLNAMRYLLQKMPYTNKDSKNIGKLDSLIVGRAHVVYERGESPGVVML